MPRAIKKTSSVREGENLLHEAYFKTKTKKRFGRTITKTTKANMTTDSRNGGKFYGSGTRTKTVTGKGFTKTKVKELSQRKLRNLI